MLAYEEVPKMTKENIKDSVYKKLRGLYIQPVDIIIQTVRDLINNYPNNNPPINTCLINEVCEQSIQSGLLPSDLIIKTLIEEYGKDAIPVTHLQEAFCFAAAEQEEYLGIFYWLIRQYGNKTFADVAGKAFCLAAEAKNPETMGKYPKTIVKNLKTMVKNPETREKYLEARAKYLETMAKYLETRAKYLEAMAKYLETMDWLTEQYDMEDIRVEHVQKAFCFAAAEQEEYLGIFYWLIRQYGNKTFADVAGEAFYLAAEIEDMGAMLWLIEQYGMKAIRVEHAQKALCVAAKEGHLNTVNWLIELYGAQAFVKVAAEALCDTLRIQGLRSPSLETADLLHQIYQKYIDPKYYGKYVLDWAAGLGHLQTIDWLFDKCREKLTEKYIKQALWTAANDAQWKVVKKLFDKCGGNYFSEEDRGEALLEATDCALDHAEKKYLSLFEVIDICDKKKIPLTYKLDAVEMLISRIKKDKRETSHCILLMHDLIGMLRTEHDFAKILIKLIELKQLKLDRATYFGISEIIVKLEQDFEVQHLEKAQPESVPPTASKSQKKFFFEEVIKKNQGENKSHETCTKQHFQANK